MQNKRVLSKKSTGTNSPIDVIGVICLDLKGPVIFRDSLETDTWSTSLIIIQATVGFFGQVEGRSRVEVQALHGKL